MKPRQRFDDLDMPALEAIAALFETEPVRQEWNLPDDPIGVWEVLYRAETGNIRVLLWPAISRIDVTVGPHMWVVKGVAAVEVIEELEFIARFGEDGVLTVARSGHVVLTAPNA